jgi:splicing factor 3A subunit 1
MNIEKNLKRMAEFRTDMFGSGGDETLIGRRKGDENEEEKLDAQVAATWDGHTSSAEATSKRALTGISLEDQIKAIHQSQGLIPGDQPPNPMAPRPQGKLCLNQQKKKKQTR